MDRVAQVEHPLIVELYNFVSHDGAGYIVIDTGPWITHRATWQTMIDQFPRFFDPAEQCIKAMIEFSNESAP